MSRTARAQAHPNIALIKYWGKRDIPLNLPAVSSLSVTLDSFMTDTTVTTEHADEHDLIVINGSPLTDRPAARVSRFLDLVASPDRPRCRVESHNNFPTAAGLASSASAFGALALATCAAFDQDLDPTRLSLLARQGSGSACRSLWGGWVRWDRGSAADGRDSHGIPVAPRDHWDLSVVVAMVGSGPKPIGSTAGMVRTQETCPLYPGWVSSAEADVAEGQAALLARDLDRLGAAMERSTYKMHATMIATWPPIRYWRPNTVAVLEAIEALRAGGLSAWSTMDAGPNVKVLCRTADVPRVVEAIERTGVAARPLGVGGDARLV
ncbi:MAG: diphosphomevalonate decarboxylase [Deltaproteobacteria bacterium]|nr:diphosphomevalonate decarboxylase [Deltaproteobacteria bacterium]HCH66212.1 diphosphomevalonate decarboxylase [Deltaproteobacteria bacterium]